MRGHSGCHYAKLSETAVRCHCQQPEHRWLFFLAVQRIVRKESKKKQQQRPYLCTQGHTPLSVIQYKVLLPKGLFLFTHFSDSKGCSKEFPSLVSSEVKVSARNVGDLGSIPGLGRSPAEGNPLQYSCLENPTDRGAWWATVHGVAKSRTQLSDFTSLHFKGCS